MPYRKARTIAILYVAAGVAISAGAQVPSNPIWVGPMTEGSRCDVATLRDALQRARQTPEADVIHVVQGAADFGQALAIQGGSITLRGGFSRCGVEAPPEGHTTISGAGHPIGSVLTIDGPGVVRLERLRIVQGDAGSHGGGIRYQGSDKADSENTLILVDTLVVQNNAGGDGGGIAFASRGDATAMLVLQGDTAFLRNSAAGSEGGGAIHLSGRSWLLAESPSLHFHENRAIRRGGALYVKQPAQVDLGAASTDETPVFWRNRAAHAGGALHVQASAAAMPPARVRLYSVVDGAPLSFEENHVDERGGALSATGAGTDGTAASICVRNVSFLKNEGRLGAAIALTQARFGGCIEEVLPVAAAPECVPRTRCNRIERNLGTGMLSSSIVDLTGGSAELTGYSIAGNRAGGYVVELAEAAGAAAMLRMENTVVADTVFLNNSPIGIVRLGTNTVLNMVHSTVANNAITPGFGSRFLFADLSGALITIDRSIVYQPGVPVLQNHPSTTRRLTNTLFHELPLGHENNPTLLAADPQFEGADNLRLTTASPAIDVAPALAHVKVDLDGNHRVVDQAEVADLFGPVDLGAYETPPMVGDRVFGSGFEGHPTPPKCLGGPENPVLRPSFDRGEPDHDNSDPAQPVRQHPLRMWRREHSECGRTECASCW